MTRMDSTCHRSQNELSDMKSGLLAADVLCLLCQDLSYCNDVLDIGKPTSSYKRLTRLD